MTLLWLAPSQGNPTLGGHYGLRPEWWGRASSDDLSKSFQAEAKVSARIQRPELALLVSGAKESAVSGVQWEERRSEPLGLPRLWSQVQIFFQGLRSYWRVWSRKGPVLIHLSERVERQEWKWEHRLWSYRICQGGDRGEGELWTGRGQDLEVRPMALPSVWQVGDEGNRGINCDSGLWLGLLAEYGHCLPLGV